MPVRARQATGEGRAARAVKYAYTSHRDAPFLHGGQPWPHVLAVALPHAFLEVSLERGARKLLLRLGIHRSGVRHLALRRRAAAAGEGSARAARLGWGMAAPPDSLGASGRLRTNNMPYLHYQLSSESLASRPARLETPWLAVT